MKIGLPTIGSFQTVDDIKFVVEAGEDASEVIWNGRGRGGKIVQRSSNDIDTYFAVNGVHYANIVQAAKASILNQRRLYEGATAIIAEIDYPAKPNPIMFNPDGMTVRQLKDCAEALRDVYNAMNRGVDPLNIIFHLDGARDQMLKKYGEPA